tara:strand:- start:1308 stop:1739 length:432 start_codon:yes stop_codon:yes gene_type:complete
MPLTLGAVDLAADPDLAGDQMEWVDEFDWDAITQSQERGLTGALLIQEGVKLHGRPITLQSNGGAWFTLATVRALEALRDQPSAVMQLVLPRGDQYWVTWNRESGPPLAAKQVIRSQDMADTVYELTLRLITVAPPPEPEPES